MTKISVIEVFVTMVLTSFRQQVQALGAMRGNPARPYAIHQLRQLILGALSTLGECESLLKVEIERGIEALLEESAQALNIISEIKNERTDLPIFDRLSEIAQRGHGGVTEKLTKVEESEIALLEKRIAKMKEEIMAVLHDLDRI